MNVFERAVGVLRNNINAAIGYQQTFEELIKNKDIPRAINMMEDRSKEAAENLRFYHTKTHKIMSRPRRPIYDKEGNYLRDKDVNRIAIPYQMFINEIALVFMYGQPVKWSNTTHNPYADERKKLMQLRDTIGNHEDPQGSVEERKAVVDSIKKTKMSLEEMESRLEEIDAYQDMLDTKFSKFTKVLEDAHFDSSIRQAKRAAGCEGCSAMLFHTYQEDGEAKLRIKVLSKENNDDIYTMFNEYDKLVALAWGYNTVDSKKRVIHHYKIMLPNMTYECHQASGGGWEVVEIPNPSGKINAIVFIQEVEWYQTETMIERVEVARSKTGDSNDNFSDPALVATQEILNTLPKQEEDSKLYVLKNGGDVHYLERENNNEARNDEADALDALIHKMTFTPNISIEELKGLSNASGETLKQIFMLAYIKADKRKETHDGYLTRTSNLVLTLLDSVLDIPGGGYGQLSVGHEFQDPFGTDLQQVLNDLLRQYNAGGLSLETLVSRSYLIKNPEKELELIKQEKEQKAREQRETMLLDVFQSAE